MVTTRNQHRNGSEEGEQPDLRDIIASQIREVFQQYLPGMFDQFKEELEQTIDAKIAAAKNGAGSSNQTQTRNRAYRDFSTCQPPQFQGKKDPLISTRWISEVEGAFRTSFCPADAKVRCAANLLRGAAKDWWDLIVKTRSDDEIEDMGWEEFKTLFMEHFAPSVEVERVAREFLSMEQTTESVTEITEKFLEKALFCPEYVASEKMKMSRYSSMLKTEIREFVVTARCQTFNEMIEVARTRELELEMQAQKRKLTQVQAPVKKFKSNETIMEPVKENKECKKCGKRHLGHCLKNFGVCYKCGKPGHKSMECNESAKLCYNCHQLGHIKPNCPQLVGHTVQAPATATLRITDGGTQRPETSGTRGRAYQLTIGENATTSNGVAGTLLILL